MVAVNEKWEQAEYQYDPYGSVAQTLVCGPQIFTGKGADNTWFTSDDVSSSVSAVGNPYTFTGRRLDNETGLMYFRNRYYSTTLGRFISRDALEYVDGWNLYRGYFAVNGMDPRGKTTIADVGGLQAAMAVALAFGLTALKCLQDAECKKAIADAIKAAIDALGDTAKLALMIKCKEVHDKYKFVQSFCSACDPSRAKSCLGRVARCAHAVKMSTCFAAEAAGRLAYIMMGCDFVLTNNFEGHVKQVIEKSQAQAKCLISAAKNCPTVFP